MTLNERRAIFVYDGVRLAALAAQAPIVPVPWKERESAFQAQFLDVIARQCGPNHSADAEDFHEEWVKSYLKMGSAYLPVYDRKHKTHPDMVPYAELGQLERDKDDVFIALCAIARQYICQQLRPEGRSPQKGKTVVYV